MIPQILLERLDDVLPAGVVLLLAVGIFFMKNHQDNMEKFYKLSLDQQNQSDKRHQDFQKNLQTQCDNSISFLEKRIDELRDEQKGLKSEVERGRDTYLNLQDKYIDLQIKIDSMVKERIEERDSAKAIVGKLEDGMNQLSIEGSQELISLKEDFSTLKKSIEQMEKVDEETKDWLQGIRNFSRSRENLAQRAAQHSRSQG